MNPTNQRILLGMISGYRSGRSLQSLLNDANFSSLPFQDRAEILKSLSNLLGDKVKVQLTAMGLTKELAAGALKGALATLPVSALIHNAITVATKAPSTTTIVGHAKNIGSSLLDIARDKSVQNVFGTVAAIGAAAGAYTSAKNLIERVKHNNQIAAGLSDIQNSATDEEAEQATANMLFSKALASGPSLSNTTALGKGVGDFATKRFGSDIQNVSTVWSATRAFDSLPSGADIDNKIVPVMANAEATDEERLQVASRILEELKANRDALTRVNEGINAAKALKSTGFKDGVFMDELSGAFHQHVSDTVSREKGLADLAKRLQDSIHARQEGNEE